MGSTSKLNLITEKDIPSLKEFIAITQDWISKNNELIDRIQFNKKYLGPLGEGNICLRFSEEAVVAG